MHRYNVLALQIIWVVSCCATHPWPRRVGW